jgi:DNA-binding MarR family transcriptional regulator
MPSRHEENPSPPSLSAVALGQRTGYLLIKLGELALQAAEDALVPVGLRARHFNVLTMIAVGTAMSQQELGTLLGIDKTLIVAVIDDLEEHELVRRRRNPEDRRRHTLELTSKGKRVLKDAYAHIDRAERELLAPLSASEIGVLRDVTTRVLSPRWPVKKPR